MILMQQSHVQMEDIVNLDKYHQKSVCFKTAFKNPY